MSRVERHYTSTGEKRLAPGGYYYKLHVPESRPGVEKNASGYVDPLEEFGRKPIDYEPEELEDFGRAVDDLVDGMAPARKLDVESTVPGSHGAIASGPFSGLDKKFAAMIRKRPSIREVSAELASSSVKFQDTPEFVALMRRCGIFLMERHDDDLHFSFMKDPPREQEAIEKEKFIDDVALTALLSERFRLKVVCNSFSYQFYFD